MKKKLVRFRNFTSVRAERERLYNAVRAGRIDPFAAAKISSLLNDARCAFSGEDGMQLGLPNCSGFDAMRVSRGRSLQTAVMWLRSSSG
jgi:hypothetical protein